MISDSIDRLRQLFEEDCATIQNMETWKSIRDKYLARESGVITAEMKKLRDLPKEERPVFGQAMNRLRAFVEETLQERLSTIKAAELSSRQQIM